MDLRTVVKLAGMFLIVVAVALLPGGTLSLVLGAGREAKALSTSPSKSGNEVDPNHAAQMEKARALFQKSVRKTLVDHCLKCHGGDSIEAEFDLSDREGFLKGGTSGQVAQVGKAQSSRLLRRLTHAEKPGMPFQGERLPAAKIAEVAAWIDLGAVYDVPLVNKKSDVVPWTERVVPAEAKEFWAFQPLRPGTPPAVARDGECRTPIDRFIVSKLEARGISPNPEATRLQLMRRASFDLLGLPPTPEEVERFLADTSPEAWDHLLDRLLDSPHYGERWGRHWLDVARFAESHGFEHDTDRPTAYHYRDFVIEALNRDLPYDTFVRWQIAGDEFAPDSILALRATGFLAAGVHSTQITKNEVEKHRYDELDDMLGTMSQAMLGLSVQCARCHDHKFDPIPQRDYYRLLATFTTTVRTEVDLDFDPEGYQRAKQTFDAAHAPLVAKRVQYEREQLPAQLAQWERNNREPLARFPWIVLEASEVKSAGGATLTRQADGSYLASGKNHGHDAYTLTIPISGLGIRGLRVEALADPTLPKGGPGRALNGNFALTDLRLTLTPSGVEGASPTPLGLSNPRATFQQQGLPVAAAIDEDEKSGWAVDPQFGKDHAAVFEVDSPAGSDREAVLTVVLTFKGNDKHNLGRLRLSIATTETPIEGNAPSVPQAIAQALRTPADKRSVEKQAQVEQWYGVTLDPEWQKLNQPVVEHQALAPRPTIRKAMISSEGLPAVRLNTQGGDFLESTHFLRRGDPNLKEAVASPGFLQVLASDHAVGRWQESPPQGWRTTYRRRVLANWLTDVEQGAGALLARVAVNRLWQHHFGRGIVATPSDFGTRGATPSHPELLDWLAHELVARNWSLKSIHKLILQSAVYRQSSQFDEHKATLDRDNTLCWRHAPRRLEAEVIRDSLLAVSGNLDSSLYGPGTLEDASPRRSIYFTVKRSKLVPMMQNFDAPDALSSVGERPSTTVAPQALMLMNNPQTRIYAQALARRVDLGNSVNATVVAAYRTALARLPTDAELADGQAFLEAQTASYSRGGNEDSRRLALIDFCQVLMCLNEFVYVD